MSSKGLKFLILFTLILPWNILSAEENYTGTYCTYFDDKSQLLIPVKIADPEEIMCDIKFLKCSNDKLSADKQFQLSFGGMAPLFTMCAADNQFVLSFNAKGMIKSRFGFFTESFDLIHSDYYGGLFVYFRAPLKISKGFEMFYYHQSSHLGDDFIFNNGGIPMNYSHEVLKLTHYLDILKNLNLSSSLAIDVRKDTSIDKGRISIQLDADYNHLLGRRTARIGGHISSSEITGWTPSYNLLLAYEMNLPDSKKSKQILSFEYFNGFSTLGQFYKKKEEHLSVGILVFF